MTFDELRDKYDPQGAFEDTVNVYLANGVSVQCLKTGAVDLVQTSAKSNYFEAYFGNVEINNCFGDFEISTRIFNHATPEVMDTMIRLLMTEYGTTTRI
jgi:hypothetical protein